MITTAEHSIDRISVVDPMKTGIPPVDVPNGPPTYRAGLFEIFPQTRRRAKTLSRNTKNRMVDILDSEGGVFLLVGKYSLVKSLISTRV